MTKRVIEHEVKLEKSVKIILAALAFGVLAHAFAPAFGVREASAALGSSLDPVHIVCNSGCIKW